jgi:catechol-2,3-dioxygenase
MSTKASTTKSTTATKASVGASMNHLVLNVRDLEASHRFYTEIMGFEQCGEMTHTLTMRFYRGDASHHHDFALVQVDDPASVAPPERWSMDPTCIGVNHIGVAYPDRESWLAQLRHLQANGVDFIVRGNHGMTHSAYIADPDGYGLEVLYNVPSEAWEDDVDAALNYFEFLGPGEELDDNTDYPVFGHDAPPPEEVPGRILARRPSRSG